MNLMNDRAPVPRPKRRPGQQTDRSHTDATETAP